MDNRETKIKIDGEGLSDRLERSFVEVLENVALRLQEERAD